MGEKRGRKKTPKVERPNDAVHQHKPAPFLIFTRLMFNCRASRKLKSGDEHLHSEQRPAGSTRAHTEPHLKGGKKEEEWGGKKEHSDVLLLSFWAARFKLRTGSFRWRHARPMGRSCLSQVRAEAFLANMHGSMETFTHYRRHRACLSPPEPLPLPPVSSSHFCHCDPADVSNRRAKVRDQKPFRLFQQNNTVLLIQRGVFLETPRWGSKYASRPRWY